MSVFEGIDLPKVIYETESAHNELIQVIDHKGVKRLVVDGMTQSMDPNSPVASKMAWGRTIRVLQENLTELNTILVMGLGGGTMQHMLAHTFPGAVIVSVELDPKMIEVAKEYFFVDQIPNHYIINDDACRIVIEPEKHNLRYQSFNAIIVDIFVGDEYPDLGNSGNFLSHLCKMVIPGGLVVINRFYLEDHQEDVHRFMDTVEMYLTDVNTIIVPGKTNSDNMLIYGRVA